MTKDQLKDILYNYISKFFISLSFNQRGTRVIQKILETILDDEELLNFYSLLLFNNLKEFRMLRSSVKLSLNA